MMKSIALLTVVLGFFWISGAQANQKFGSECFACHQNVQKSHTKGNHAGLDCAVCHSGVDKHLKNPGAGTKPGKPADNSCQSCHAKNSKLMSWKFADHTRAGVKCSDCHSIHSSKIGKGGKLASSLKDKNSEMCISCHQGVMSRFNMPSRHPVKEGAMSCINCHDPHASKQTSQKSKTEQCTKCHQSVRGPHAMEHAPVTEDCMICHNPHGSPQRKLLKTAQPTLCIQCHTVAGRRHGVSGNASQTQRITGAALRNCTGCHAQIHGSSGDPHMRF